MCSHSHHDHQLHVRSFPCEGPRYSLDTLPVHPSLEKIKVERSESREEEKETMALPLLRNYEQNLVDVLFERTQLSTQRLDTSTTQILMKQKRKIGSRNKYDINYKDGDD